MLGAGIPGLIIDRLWIMCYTQMYFDNVFVYSMLAVVVLVNSILSRNRFLRR